MATYASISGSTDIGSRPPSVSSQSRRPPAAARGQHAKMGYSGSASWSSSVVNLVNTIVGAGVLAMPHALSNMGITLGTLIILWAGLTSGFGLYLQTQCARYLDRGASSFFALSQITYPNAAVLFDAAIAIKCFGVGVSYLIIIGDLMPHVVRGLLSGIDDGIRTGFLLDRHFWVTAFMLIVIPLSFLRKLDSLKYTSIIALVSIAYLVVLVVYHFSTGDTLPARGEVHWFKWQGPIATLSSFPVIVFAYTCHQNMFSILNEIHNPTPLRTTGVVVASIGTAASIYILVAITGYLSFGTNVVGNIISQYTPSIASTIGRAAIVVLVMFSYPLQVHPCRASLDAVSKWRPSSLSSSKRNGELTPTPSSQSLISAGAIKAPTAQKPKEELSELRFAVLTTAIIILSYVAAMTINSLDKVLAYVGATGSTSISFILPGLFYYKISSPDSPHHQRLLKDEDDEEYEGGGSSSHSPSSSDDEAMTTSDSYLGRQRAAPTGSSWTDAWRSHLRIRGRGRRRGGAIRRDVIRKLSLALAIYGFVVLVVCLCVNIFGQSTGH